MEWEKSICPVLKIDGVLATGKQFDLDITLPEDNRSVIYGVVKDCCHDPICNAVVKLVEVDHDCGKEERRPVSHTFTDENGEFVFGPLCANKFYEIVIWVDEVKHCKICTSCKHEGKCLKGIKLECSPCDMHHEKHDEKHDECHCEKHCEKHDEDHCEKHDDKHCEKHCDKPCDDFCDKHCDKPCNDHCDKHDDKHCDRPWDKKSCNKLFERPCR